MHKPGVRARTVAKALVVALAMATTTVYGQSGELEDLVEAAKSEPATTVYAVTGKIVDTAEAFSAKYGLQVTGKKVNEAGQVDLLIREHQAGNVAGSVSLASDASVIIADLLGQGVVESWVPEDIVGELPESARNPLVVVSDPHVWAYNSAAYEACPISNIWQLTDAEWSRRVALMDPLDKPAYADWFNQLALHHDDAVAAAYEAYYGKPFDTTTGSATQAWVKAFAANSPLIGDSDVVTQAIGVAEQEQPFFGMLSTAKFRDNASKGFKLKICAGMQPFSGWLYPGLGVIATGTSSPNTAKLFIHYLLTEEGIDPQRIDGKVPSDPRIGLPADEASGVSAVMDQLMVWDTSSAVADIDARQDWQDTWRMSLTR
tara:strand:+ start:4829 stop:5950 length:1122 start_codon:yes stop_codon:yes gene_type:complete